MATSPATSAAVTTWKIDPAHSSAEFKVKHMMISNVKGSIKGLAGDVQEHATDSSLSVIEATLDVSTLSTGDAQRDGHLKSGDFLDVEKFRTIAFTGDLTIHGVTRQVTLEVEGPSAPQKDPWGNTRIGLEATTKINRKDFGLTWN